MAHVPVRSFALLIWSVLVFQASLAAVPRALVLYSYFDELPWQRLVRHGLQDSLASQAALAPMLFEERLDASRLGEKSTPSALAEYLIQKYSAQELNLIVTEGAYAASFLRGHPGLFPGVRRYYVNHGQGDWRPDDGSGVELREDFRAALRIIPELVPGLSRLVVVADHSPAAVSWLKAIRAEEADFPRGVEFQYWDDFSFGELLDRAAALGRGSALFFLPVFVDRTGQRIVPFELARKLAAAAGVPVFVHHDTLMGSGVVGGYELSAEKVGRMIAGILLQAGNPDIRPPAPPDGAYSYIFDASAPERHGLAYNRLPADASLVNLPRHPWDSYRWQIAGILLLLILETTLVLALLYALRGRRLALASLQDERALLEQRVAERTRELANANRELGELAITDPLTGLFNRRKLISQAQLEIERSQRLHLDLSVMEIDIDHFKLVNDSRGHAAGDRALKALAATGLATLRSFDTLARFGGEEFMILLPGATLAEARTIAERLRSRIAETPIAGEGEDDAFRITVSIGIATLAAGSPDPGLDDLFRRADQALYRAKNAGRNQVAVD